MKKRLAAILLCLCMAFTLLPATALAADGEIIYLGGVELLGSADAPVYAMTQDGRVIPSGENNYNIKWTAARLP